MLSRRGKGTTYEYNVFHNEDPLLQEKRYKARLEADQRRKEEMSNSKNASIQAVKVK